MFLPILRIKKIIQPYILILPALVVILSVVLFPIIYAIVISFFNWSFLPDIPRTFVGLQNYSFVIRDNQLYDSLKITGIYVVVCTTVEMLLGLGIALILDNPRIKGMRVINSIFVLPLIVAPVSLGIIWKMLYDQDFGAVNAIISFFSGIPKAQLPIWLSDYNIALWSVILVDIWAATPFFMLLFAAGLKNLPTEPFEAAKVDGASNWQCFRYLTLNYLKPIIIISLVFRVVDTFRVFDLVYGLTRGGPRRITQTLSITIFKVAFKNYALGEAATYSVLLLIIAGFIAWSIVKFIRFEIK